MGIIFSMKPEITLITLNMNTCHFLKELLPSISKQTFPRKNIEVIVGDNGSTDGSIEYVRKNFPYIKILRWRENCGVPKGYNRAWKASKGKYIVLVGSDTILPRNLIENLYREIKRTKSAVVCATEFYPSESMKQERKTNALNILFYNSSEIIGSKDSVAFPDFNGCILDRSKMPNPPFDSDYFAYGEDVGLALSMFLSGKKMTVGKDCKIWHYGFGTSITNSDISFFLNRNRLINILLFLEPLTIMKILPLLLADIITRLALLAFMMQKKRLKNMLAAILYIFGNFNTILRKRHQIQSNRTVSDTDLLRKLSYRVYENFEKKSQTARILDIFIYYYCRLLGIKTYDGFDYEK